MDNLKSPAIGFTAHFDGENTEVNYGFTKLELAALMIAQGIVTREFVDTGDTNYISIRSVNLAKAILDECNK